SPAPARAWRSSPRRTSCGACSVTACAASASRRRKRTRRRATSTGSMTSSGSSAGPSPPSTARISASSSSPPASPSWRASGPTTDPYVVHHGALGSFATIYLPRAARIADVRARLAALDGIDVVLDRADACARFELPPDRVGDLVVVSRRDVVVGTSASRHDLSGLDAPLRSHGGLSEQRVPFVIDRPTRLPETARLRNFDLFDAALNS